MANLESITLLEWEFIVDYSHLCICVEMIGLLIPKSILVIWSIIPQGNLIIKEEN